MTGTKEEADRLFRVGTNQYYSKDYYNALSSYYNALEIYRSVSDSTRQGLTLNAIGLTHYQLNTLFAAFDLYHQAFHLFSSSGIDMEGKAMVLNNLGIIYDLRGEIPAAIAIYEEALTIFKKIAKSNEESIVRQNLSRHERSRLYEGDDPTDHPKTIGP